MRIGIIGAGQLGQMLGDAAVALGHQCRFIDPADNPPAARVGEVIAAAFDDTAALSALAQWADVITYEFENVPVAALESIDGTVFPPREALQQTQDRLTEKQLFERLRIALPDYATIDSADDLQAAIESLGLPFVVKTRRFGYDGKGQFVVRSADDCDAAWAMLDGRPGIAESWVKFDCEVSIIAVRSASGDIRAWPLTQNEHRDGILHMSRAPVDNPALQSLAHEYATRLLEHFDYVGVLALELFVVGDRLLANEYAPRVHNSGHWTIEGAETSQFSNHIRAVCCEELGATTAKGHAGMLNLIGNMPHADLVAESTNAVLHDYGKAPRPGRKLGHITVLHSQPELRDKALDQVAKSVTQST